MEKLTEILKDLEQGKISADNAEAKVLRLFDIRRSDSPKCLKCGADESKQSCIGKWEDGEEYRCDECGNEWDFHHFA